MFLHILYSSIATEAAYIGTNSIKHRVIGQVGRGRMGRVLMNGRLMVAVAGGGGGRVGAVRERIVGAGHVQGLESGRRKMAGLLLLDVRQRVVLGAHRPVAGRREARMVVLAVRVRREHHLWIDVHGRHQVGVIWSHNGR